MTPLLNQQLDQLYHFQAQQRSAGAVGPLPHRDSSSQVRSNSLSTIGHRPPRSISSPNLSEHGTSPTTTPAGPRQYSLELRRQQEEQLRRIQQLQQQHGDAVAAGFLDSPEMREQQHRLQQEEEELRRRSSEEELFLMHMTAGVYHPQQQQQQGNGSDNSTNTSHSGHRSPLGHPYFPPHPQAYDGDHHTQHHLHHHRRDGLADIIIDGHHRHQQRYPHPAEMGQYPLVDGHPLQLDLGVVVEGSPTGMIKFESPLELE